MLKVALLTSAFIISSFNSVTSKGINDKPIFSKHSFNHPSRISDVSFNNPSYPSSNIQSSEDYFSCPKYGPFHVGDPDFEATFTYRVFGPSRAINERIRGFSPAGKVIFSIVQPLKDYIEDSLEEVTFTIPIRDYLTNEGLTFKFEIYDRNLRKVVKEHGVTIYPIDINKPTLSELKSSAYETKALGFYGDGKDMKPIIERYDFTSISDYLDIDYYYRLNIQDISFDFDSISKISYSNIFLRFEDRENLFPYLSHNGTNVRIPLNANLIGKKVHLSYKNNFFVNRTTLQLADSSREGFLSTKNFYLPINGKKQFNNKLLYLDIVNLGLADITVSFPIRYIADRSLVGLCGEGGYYVEGGIK